MYKRQPAREGTWGTETSKYPEEEKSNEMPTVAASEEGRAQTEKPVSYTHLDVYKRQARRSVHIVIVVLKPKYRFCALKKEICTSFFII